MLKLNITTLAIVPLVMFAAAVARAVKVTFDSIRRSAN